MRDAAADGSRPHARAAVATWQTETRYLTRVSGVTSEVLRSPRTWGVGFSPCYSRTSVARVLTFRDH